MKKVSAFSAFAVFASLLASPVFGGEPTLNIKAICKSREADARMLRSTPAQSTEDCVHDEEAAKTQLRNLWASTSASVRNRCVLTCIQMEEEMKSGAKKP